MNEERKLDVLLVKANQRPQEVTITDSLESEQKLVGGMIELYMPFDDDAAIICNEEGKLIGLPLNRAIYDSSGSLGEIRAGDFFICRAPADSDRFESLTEEQKKKYSERFKYPERFQRTIKGIRVIQLKERTDMER